jgi:hypothetical protein
VIPNRKLLLPALLALLALSAGFSATATAAEFHVETEEAEAIQLTGGYPVGEKTPSAEEAFTFHFGSVSTPCLQAAFTGTMPAATAESATFDPGLAECIAWSFTMGSCDFVLDADGTLAIEGGAECESEPIELEPQSGCKVQIGPQQNLETVTLENNGSGSERDVTATFNVTGLHYKQVTLFCIGGKGTFENGELTGVITLRADDEKEAQQGLWVE